MKQLISVRSIWVAALATMSLGAATPLATAKTTKPFFATGVGTFSGSKLQGTIPKSTFGKGTYKGTVAFPKSTAVWKFAKGTITVTSVGRVEGSNLVGTFKIVKGTKKYKGATGGGKFTSVIKSGKSRYDGKVTLR